MGNHQKNLVIRRLELGRTGKGFARATEIKLSRSDSLNYRSSLLSWGLYRYKECDGYQISLTKAIILKHPESAVLNN